MADVLVSACLFFCRPCSGIYWIIQQRWINHIYHPVENLGIVALFSGNAHQLLEYFTGVERYKCFCVEVTFVHGCAVPSTHPMLPIELIKGIKRPFRI